MAERFVVTGLTLRYQPVGKRVLATFELRHLIPEDAGSDPVRIRIDPISTSLNEDEVRKAREMVFGGLGQLGNPAAPGLVLKLKEPGNGQYRLETEDGQVSLLVPPRKLHR